MKKLLTMGAASLLLAACAADPKTTAADTRQGTVQATGAAREDAVPQLNAGSQPLVAAKHVAIPHQTGSVYFDFDQSGIKPEFLTVVKQQAAWMKSHDHAMVTLEGNADERGSAEYNLALGSRRAVAVEHVLVALGIPPSRIKEVSFGEQKPKAKCSEEICWKENRRVDFDYQAN